MASLEHPVASLISLIASVWDNARNKLWVIDMGSATGDCRTKPGSLLPASFSMSITCPEAELGLASFSRFSSSNKSRSEICAV